MFDRFFDSGEAGTAAKKSMTLMVSVTIHVVLIVAVIILPMLFPDTVSGSIQRLSFLVMPPLPPAPPPAPPPEATARRTPRTVVEDAFQAPVEIPREILIGMDEAPPPESLIAGIPGGVPGGIPGGVPGGIVEGVIGGDPDSMDPLPLPPAPPQAQPPRRVRVGGSVQHAILIRQVRPRYPAPALQARIQGTVVLEAIIGTGGSVKNLRVIKGHPLLIRRALEAVRQWRYQPTLLNGVPVEVITRITVRFNLARGRNRWKRPDSDCPPYDFHRARVPEYFGFRSAAI